MLQVIVDEFDWIAGAVNVSHHWMLLVSYSLRIVHWRLKNYYLQYMVCVIVAKLI